MADVPGVQMDQAGHVYSGDLNLFQLPVLSNSFSSEDSVDIRSTSSNLNSGSSIDYVLPPSVNQFTSLKETRHHVKVRILHEDNTPLEADEICGFVNWPAVSIFDSCSLSLNQTLISASGGQDHGYRAIIQAMLDRARSDKDTILQAGLYWKETAARHNSFRAPGTSFMERWQYFASSQIVHLVAPLILDIAEQPRLLLNNLEITVRFWPAKPAFCLCTAEKEKKYKFEIVDSFLRVRRKTPQPAIIVGVEKALELTPCLIPFMRCEFRKYLIQSGVFSYSLENLWEGNCPSYVILALVKANAVAGRLDANPYCFIPGSLSSLTVFADDKPIQRFLMKFDETSFLKSDFMDGFESLYQESADEGDPPSGYCHVSRSDYARGSALYLVKFNSASAKNFLPVKAMANVKLELQFDRAPTENLQLLVYAKFATLLTIDKTRRVTL